MPKRWCIGRGSKTHPCNPHLDEIRASLGAERLPFEYSGAEFDLKWVKRAEHIGWATFDGRRQLVNWPCAVKSLSCGPLFFHQGLSIDTVEEKGVTTMAISR
jgi:hypothetical protein